MGPGPKGKRVMPIPAETLNSQLIAREVHTGVYQTHKREIAVVVRVKEGKVHYLALDAKCRIVLEATDAASFLRDHPLELYHYPIRRAVRKFARWVRVDHLPVTDEARKVINAILVK